MKSPKPTHANSEYCLGVNLLGHDGSICLLDLTGTPVMVLEEERYRRLKRGEFVVSPTLLEHLWNETGVDAAQIKLLAVANIQALREFRPPASRGQAPWQGYDRLMAQMLPHYVAQLPSLDAIVYVRHHLAHAASTYYPSGFQNAAILTIDGKGEHESATICVGEQGVLHSLVSVPLPTSLGYLYEQIATWAGLRGAERAGKLMALSTYGSDGHLDLLRRALFDSTEGGQCRLSSELRERPATRTAWAQYLLEMLGPPRSPNDPLTAREYDVAYALQRIVEEIILSLVQEAHQLSGLDDLCLAGGVFANSVVNGEIVRQGLFRNVYVPPWPNDTGLSIGAALYAIPNRHTTPLRQWPAAAFLGAQATDAEIRAALNKWELPVEKLQQNPAKVAAELLSQGLVVGWYQGPMEVGPRALGSRSILALSNRKEMADHINAHIKFRELWRPFAPAILDKETEQLFDRNYESPYMSFVHPVTAKGQQALAATLSIDNMARLQVVTAEENPLFYQLLKFVREFVGVGAVLNTSFNVQGEPIIRTPDEAIRAFLATGIDVLIMDDYIVHKAQLPSVDLEIPSPTVKYPRLVPSALSNELKDKSCMLLWMDTRIQAKQVALLCELGNSVEAIPLPKNWTSDHREAHRVLDELCNTYDFIVLGSLGYLAFTLTHLHNVVEPFINHKAIEKTLILDRDLSMKALQELLLHPSGISLFDDQSELEFIWQNLREVD